MGSRCAWLLSPTPAALCLCLLSACAATPANPETPQSQAQRTTEVTPPGVEAPPPADAPPVSSTTKKVTKIGRATLHGPGHLDPALFKYTMGRHQRELRKCHSKAVASVLHYDGEEPQDPELRQHLSVAVVLAFTVEADGTLSHVRVRPHHGDFQLPGLASCMEKEAKTMEFRAPQGGPVRVSMPFSFKHSPR